MPFLLSGPDIPLPVYLDARLQAGILAMPLPGNALSYHILQEPDDGDGNSTVRQQIPAKMSSFAISATHPIDNGDSEKKRMGTMDGNGSMSSLENIRFK